jgi:uncharacterized protein (DUF1330 family)
MAAYVISEAELLDPALIVEYRSLAQATIAKYGGRYVIRGGSIESVEGDWAQKRPVIVESPTMDQQRTHSLPRSEPLAANNAVRIPLVGGAWGILRREIIRAFWIRVESKRSN